MYNSVDLLGAETVTIPAGATLRTPVLNDGGVVAVTLWLRWTQALGLFVAFSVHLFLLDDTGLVTIRDEPLVSFGPGAGTPQEEHICFGAMGTQPANMADRLGQHVRSAYQVGLEAVTNDVTDASLFATALILNREGEREQVAAS